MSDPSTDGPYTCCGRDMAGVEFSDVYDGVCAYYCYECGIWRHRLPPNDRRRPWVHRAMTAFMAEREGAK